MRLEPSADTIELDHIVAMTFGWWEAVLRDRKPFDLNAWSAALQPKPALPVPPTLFPVPIPPVT